MTLSGKLLVAVLAALLAAALFSSISSAAFATLLLCAGTAALAAVLISHRALPMPATLQRSGNETPVADAVTGERESGVVKWFNGTKGFGFVVRPDSQEIFVHYRSIRGSGRRSLRDGQRVSYRVAQTAKGPQAEDVEELD